MPEEVVAAERRDRRKREENSENGGDRDALLIDAVDDRTSPVEDRRLACRPNDEGTGEGAYPPLDYVFGAAGGGGGGGTVAGAAGAAGTCGLVSSLMSPFTVTM